MSDEVEETEETEVDSKMKIPEEQLENFKNIRNQIDEYLKAGEIDLSDKSSFFFMLNVDFKNQNQTYNVAGLLPNEVIVNGLINALAHFGVQIVNPETMEEMIEADEMEGGDSSDSVH